MKQYKIKVYFKKGYLFKSKIDLVKNDYNSTEFTFEFDIEDGRNVFEMKCPNGEIYVKDIIDNKIQLVDYDGNLNPVSLIPIVGTYEFEIVHYAEESKLTLQEHGYFTVRDEVVEVNNSEIENDSKFSILDSLINDVEKMKDSTAKVIENTNKNSEYAKEQGDYAKEQAQKVIDSNSQATEIINNFEENVDTYTGNFNKNVEDKLESYNQNDTNKTNSYNENASSKLKEYNDNHTEKMDAYNTNHTNKLKSYNDNATSKISEYNTNATQKETDFNTNTETKVTEYNENHESKMQEYNENAATKVNEFNEEVESLRDELNDCYKNQLIGQAEGTSVYINDSADARMRFLEIDGALEQDLPNPEYPQDIEVLENIVEPKVNNKNLIKNELISKTVNGVTITINEDKSISLKGIIDKSFTLYLFKEKHNFLKKGIEYTLSHKCTLPAGVYFRIQNSNNTDLFYGIGTKDTSASESLTFSYSKNLNDKIDCIIWFGSYSIGKNIDFTLYPQLEEGTKETFYEPYHEETININLEDNFIAKINEELKDTLRIENGHAILNKKIGKIILDGVESWSQNSGKTLFYTPINDILEFNNNAKAPDLISNYYLPISFNNAYSGIDDYGITYNHSQKAIAIRNKDYLNIEDFVESLKENPIEVYYPLAEPYDIDLGPFKLPKTFKGVSNIFLNANLETSFKIEYVKDTNIVIDNLSKAIVALGGDNNV